MLTTVSKLLQTDARVLTRLCLYFCPPQELERKQFVHALSRVIELVAFAPAEEIFHKGEKALKLYSIFKGLIGTEGGVLFSGKSFGHEMVLGNAERVSNATALSFTDLYQLTHTALTEIFSHSNFPETQALVRRKSLWVAVKMKFLHISRRLRATPGYVQKSFEYKMRVKRHYRKLAQQRHLAREKTVSMSEVISSAKELGVGVVNDEQLAQMEIEFLRDGAQDGYLMPAALKKHLQETGNQQLNRDMAEHLHRKHVETQLKVLSQRIERIESTSMATHEAVQGLASEFQRRTVITRRLGPMPTMFSPPPGAKEGGKENRKGARGGGRGSGSGR